MKNFHSNYDFLLLKDFLQRLIDLCEKREWNFFHLMNKMSVQSFFMLVALEISFSSCLNEFSSNNSLWTNIRQKTKISSQFWVNEIFQQFINRAFILVAHLIPFSTLNVAQRKIYFYLSLYVYIEHETAKNSEQRKRAQGERKGKTRSYLYNVKEKSRKFMSFLIIASSLVFSHYRYIHDATYERPAPYTLVRPKNACDGWILVSILCHQPICLL